ncbi:hypothetical protein PVAG01_05085 [Phlyctema vagabunda]|uniref:Uncharacterized protein n=1 Tax=Phlyctema vagabunda TaxID=108571 RepID=A0ABR4PJD5_9HELO
MPARASTIATRQSHPKKKQLIVKLRSHKISEFLRARQQHHQQQKSKLPFSQSQVAFATLLVKTKPAGLTIQEYAGHLRNGFCKRKEISDSSRQIEPAEYWKSRAQQLQTQLDAANEKIRDLEARGEGSLGREGLCQAQILLRQPQTPYEDSEPVKDIGKEGLDPVRSPPSDINFPKPSHGHIYALTFALSYASKSFALLKLHNAQDVEVAVTALCQNIAGRRRKGHLVVRLLKLVDAALENLHSLAKVQAEVEYAENQAFTQPLMNWQHKQPKDGFKVSQEYLISSYIEKFLVEILDSKWQPGQGGHRELLEGTRYHIITRTSHVTRIILFTQPRSISDQHMEDNIPLVATLLESRHLLRIVYASLGKANRNKEKLFNEVLGDGPTTLMDKGRVKLQATLARGCFPSADAQFFQEAYQTPSMLDEATSTLEVPCLEQMCFDWILNATMTLIGLDLVIPMQQNQEDPMVER